MGQRTANRFWALVMLATLPSATVDCGVLLHPERNGHREGRVDAVSLVFDCLWLLVGVIPGVVALAVDFATGGVYESGRAINVVPGQQVTFRLRGEAPQDAEVAVTIRDAEERASILLDRKVARGEAIGDVGLALPANLAAGRHALVLTVNDRPTAAWNLNVASAQE